MAKWFQSIIDSIIDWFFRLLYGLLTGLLDLVSIVESFFDVFAGTAPVTYKGEDTFLLNVFLGNSTISNAFWAMALIAVVLAFIFCIIQIARKATDIAGTVKQSVGQIMTSFFRCLLIIVMVNAATVMVINISNVVLDRINFALSNAAQLDIPIEERTFTDEEYALMTRVLATVGNYSVNPDPQNRYNVNSCFNAIRGDLQKLEQSGMFRYSYPSVDGKHYTWQGAVALLAASADLTKDLPLDEYNQTVANAFSAVSREILTYADFAPAKSVWDARYLNGLVGTNGQATKVRSDALIFLMCTMDAANSSHYNGQNASLDDPLRSGYAFASKDYHDLAQVRSDFNIWEFDYLIGYFTSIIFVVLMAICIFTLIVRIFNVLLLYLTAPLFASVMPLDDGGKWQAWLQSFVIQVFSVFGMVISMRLYLIFIPIMLSSDMVFFSDTTLNNAARLMMILGGTWAVVQSNSLITGILSGNPAGAAAEQERRMTGMVTAAAWGLPGAALGATKKIAGGIKAIKDAPENYKKRQLEKDQLKNNWANREMNSAEHKAKRDAFNANKQRIESNRVNKAYQNNEKTGTKDAWKAQKQEQLAANAEKQARKSAKLAGASYTPVKQKQSEKLEQFKKDELAEQQKRRAEVGTASMPDANTNINLVNQDPGTQEQGKDGPPPAPLSDRDQSPQSDAPVLQTPPPPAPQQTAPTQHQQTTTAPQQQQSVPPPPPSNRDS